MREQEFLEIIRDNKTFVDFMVNQGAIVLEDNELVSYNDDQVNYTLFSMSMYDHLNVDESKEEEMGYKLISQDGGGEGGGEYCESVFQIGGIFYKTQYSYYSYNGFEYDYISLKKVQPKRVEVTVYE